jgi:hypothetical protein
MEVDMSQLLATGAVAADSPRRIQPIERRNAATLPYQAFLDEFVVTNRPVIISDAVPEWNALHTWTPQFFKDRFGSRTVDVTYGISMNFADLIDAVLASTPEKPSPYLHKVIIHQHMPELLADLQPENEYSLPRRYCSPLMPRRFRRPDGYLKLLIGGPGGKFPLMHFDADNPQAMITEIYGDKEFVLFAPSDTRYVYPSPGSAHTSQIEDIGNPDLSRFPLLRQAVECRGAIHPGEAIFVPCGWWHSAHVLTASISVCVNMLEAASWHGFIAECCSAGNSAGPKVAAKRIYLEAAGNIMNAVEKLQNNHPSASIARSIAFLAPVSSRDVHGRRHFPPAACPAA